MPPQRFEKHHKNIQNILHDLRLIQDYLPNPDDPIVTRKDMQEVFSSFSAIAMNMVKRGINQFISTVESQDTYLEDGTCCEDMEEEIVTDDDGDDEEQSLDWTAKIRKEYCTTLVKEMEIMMHRRAGIALLRRRKSAVRARQEREESSGSETETASNTSTEPKCTATTTESEEEEDDETTPTNNAEEWEPNKEREQNLDEVADILSGIQEETEEDWELDNLIGTTATVNESAVTPGQNENSEGTNDTENAYIQKEDKEEGRNDKSESTQPARARRSARLATSATTTAKTKDTATTRPPLQDITQIEKPSEAGGTAQS